MTEWLNVAPLFDINTRKKAAITAIKARDFYYLPPSPSGERGEGEIW